jgi:hypothetical protein
MTTGTTSLLELALPVEGELDGAWGDVVNNGVTRYVDIAVAGTLTLDGDGAITLVRTTGNELVTNIGATTAQYAIIRVTGTLTTTKVITAPSVSKTYVVDNAATGGAVTFKATGQTGVSVAVGEKCTVYYNGTDFVKVASSVADGVTSVGGTGTVNGISLSGTVTSTGNLTLGGALTGVSLATQVTGTLPIANGGTGTTSTTFANLATNVTGLLPVANGGTGTGTPALVAGSNVTITGTWPNQTIAAAAPGTGTVTAVTASAPLASSGGATPDISFTGTLATANGGTGNANGTVAKLATTNFTIEESGGKLVFKYGATTIGSMSSTGVFTTLSDITGNGTP